MYGLRAVCLILGVCLVLAGFSPPVSAAERAAEKGGAVVLPPIPLTLEEILAWVDRSHPLLKGAGAEKIMARGKLLKALGAFEPNVVNDSEIERFISSSDPTKSLQTAGFNDTFVDFQTPSGFKGLAGFRRAIGNARIPDLTIGDNQQILVGAQLPLLKGLLINPASAEMQRSELADPRADVQIAQTRQDLFLAAASQYWDWVGVWKLADVHRRALKVAEDRFKQVEARAKAGAVAPLDVVEANQEVQRRKEALIAATRLVEQEQYKLSLFLWERDGPMTPAAERVPEFPKAIDLPPAEQVRADKVNAKTARPEIRAVAIDAQINNIDLELAKNNLLPSLDVDATPARSPEKFVLGLGYKFGVEFRMPILQRKSRGEVLEAQGKADRFVLLQRYREQQVVVDVDNALSAIERAKERITAAFQSLQLARTLEEGERFRFSLGATSVLFVNLRERNTVDSEAQYIRAQADYHRALAQYQWAVGTWAKSPESAIPVNYKPLRPIQ